MVCEVGVGVGERKMFLGVVDLLTGEWGTNPMAASISRNSCSNIISPFV